MTAEDGTRPLQEDAMDKALLSLPEFGQLTGLGQTTVKRLVREGTVVSVKVGDRRLIPATAVRQFVDRLVAEAATDRALVTA
jgi:excisionase family DNA binding protein